MRGAEGLESGTRLGGGGQLPDPPSIFPSPIFRRGVVRIAEGLGTRLGTTSAPYLDRALPFVRFE